MAAAAPELDGTRLQTPGEPAIWLMMHGRRRLISSMEVYNNLFIGNIRPVVIAGVDHIERGSDLVEGSCLAQPEGADALYLVTGGPDDRARKHYITSPECFHDFGFNGERIRVVPPFILAAVPDGLEILSGYRRP